MKSCLILPALVALTVSAFAEDAIKATVSGSAELVGVDQTNGKLVGDSVPNTYAKVPTQGKVKVVTNNGRVSKIETYTSWTAQNNVRGYVWEKLWVSGGTYTGWSERLLETSDHITFSRNVIDGSVAQKFKPDGSGSVEWTVAGSDNGVDNSDTSATTSNNPSDGTLPTVDIDEENEFDGVSDRKIEIRDRGHDRVSVTFTDVGYVRVTLDSGDLQTEYIVNQKLTLAGTGKGSLSFDPNANGSSDNSSPTPTPGPTPDVSPTPTPGDVTPTPTPGDVTPTPTPTPSVFG